MHVNPEPTTRSGYDTGSDDTREPSGARRRTRRGLVVCALTLSFTVAGPAVAQADDRWDRSDGGWDGSSESWSGNGSAAAAPAPAAPAPAPAAPAPAAVAPADLSGAPTPSSTAYSAWAPHVRPVVAEIVKQFGVPTVYTRPGHSPTQELAADFMVYSEQAMGDAVAAYVIANAARMNVDYVIWQQRIYIIGGSGWTPMEDRGSPTANHMDHVHVSFTP